MADSNTVSPSPALDESPLHRNGNLIMLYFLLLAPLVTSASWGFDLSLTNGLQSVDVFIDNFGNHLDQPLVSTECPSLSAHYVLSFSPAPLLDA
jgi:hypothetical protein